MKLNCPRGFGALCYRYPLANGHSGWRNPLNLLQSRLSVLAATVVAAGGRRVGRPHWLLHRSEVGAGVEQVAGEGAPEVVGRKARQAEQPVWLCEVTHEPVTYAACIACARQHLRPECPYPPHLLSALHAANQLDIGSGRGKFLWPLLDAFPDLSVTAVDSDPKRVRDLEAVQRMRGASGR